MFKALKVAFDERFYKKNAYQVIGYGERKEYLRILKLLSLGTLILGVLFAIFMYKKGLENCFTYLLFLVIVIVATGIFMIMVCQEVRLDPSFHDDHEWWEEDDDEEE